MLKRILVALGGTEHTHAAIRHAIDIAMRHGASVTGVTVVDVHRPERASSLGTATPGRRQVLRDRRITVARERVARSIKELVRACEAARVSHQVHRGKGDALDLVLSHAKYHDLVVVGLRSQSEHGVAGDSCDTLLQLVSRGVRPILAVAREHRDVRRVMIAYSGSMESAKAMKRFVELRL